MDTGKIVNYAAAHALGAVVYIALAVSLLANIEPLFPEYVPESVAMFAMLLLFVTSVAVMGLLIFARPLMWYFAEQKKEAVKLVTYTVGFLVLVSLLSFLVIFIIIS